MSEKDDVGSMLLYKPRILVIGAGLTSSLLTRLIRQNEKLTQLLDLHIWEGSDRVGGRFMTLYGPQGKSSYVDLGAQYLTQSSGHASTKYYQQLLQAGLLREMNTTGVPGFRQDDTKINYACTQGAASVVQYFFDQFSTESSHKIVFNKTVTQMHAANLNGRPKLQIWNNDNEREIFDVVISTIPVTQLLELGNIPTILKENPTIEAEIQKVAYSSRYAAGIFYSNPLKLAADSAHSINFVSNPSSPVRYWAIENMKRSGIGSNEASDTPASIVVHMGVGFEPNRNLTDREFENNLRDMISEEIKHPVPPFPYFNLHYWKCSQVTTPYPGSPGYVKLLNEPLLIATGDGFSGSGFEGCVTAAESTFNYLLDEYEELRKVQGAV